jgi:hypothetical protein
MSCVLFLTQAFEVMPSVRNAKQYIQEIVFTIDGYNDSTPTINIDGSGGNASFAGTVSAEEICLSGDCRNEWPTG